MMSGILLACSRATYACILIAIIIYVILQKDKTDKIKTIGVSISILILAILYSKIFLEYYQTKNCIVIIGALIILALLTSFFNYLVNRSYKILKKYWIIFTILLLILAWMSFKILTIEAPLELFKNKNEIVTERIYEITNLKNEKAYLLEFDVNSKAKDDLEIYRIQVIERNVKGAVTAIHEESFGTINGKKIIAFMRKEDTDYIEMIFRSINVTNQQGLTINHLTINGKTVHPCVIPYNDVEYGGYYLAHYELYTLDMVLRDLRFITGGIEEGKSYTLEEINAVSVPYTIGEYVD